MLQKQKKTVLRVVFFLTLSILSLSQISLNQVYGVNVATPEGQEEQPLRVVTKPIAPFVIKEQDRLSGFSIDLWKEIAMIADLPFEFIEVETVSDQLEAVINGEADVAIAAISMTPEREILVDFSYPYYRSGLQIMTSSQQSSNFFPILTLITLPKLFTGVGMLLLILLTIGHLAWLVERKNNDDFSKGYLSGIWDGIWWAATTLTTVGYGDKVVKNTPGQILGIIWMFASIFLIAYFTAFVTAESTVLKLSGSINSVTDLFDKRVVTVKDTTSAVYLREHYIPFRAVETIEEAYHLLQNKQIEAIVYDAPVLQYYAGISGHGELIVVGTPFKREDYGIAVPPNSPYEEKINKALLDLKFNGTYDEILSRWSISEE